MCWNFNVAVSDWLTDWPRSGISARSVKNSYLANVKIKQGMPPCSCRRILSAMTERGGWGEWAEILVNASLKLVNLKLQIWNLKLKNGQCQLKTKQCQLKTKQHQHQNLHSGFQVGGWTKPSCTFRNVMSRRPSWHMESFPSKWTQQKLSSPYRAYANIITDLGLEEHTVYSYCYWM